jgi:ArsR family transcriptional regulator, arsenate/arsenite/antimonite-responsive transcriptional repressor
MAMCACEIESILGLSQSNASRHLSKLLDCGLITYERKAQWIYYSLSEEILDRLPFLKEIPLGKLDEEKVFKEDDLSYENYKKSGLGCKSIMRER